MRYEDVDWERANCRGADTEAFFPGFGGLPSAARRVCARCEIKEPCEQYAVDNEETGLWGGRYFPQRIYKKGEIDAEDKPQPVQPRGNADAVPDMRSGEREVQEDEWIGHRVEADSPAS